MMRVTTKSSLVDQVIEQMRGEIESGEWPVGTKIPPEPRLAAAMAVGRNTTREAVRALVHAGLLVPRQGDGTYVLASSDLGPALRRRLRRAGARELLEVRNSLERDAARLAAERRTEEDLSAVADAVARQARAEADGDLAGCVDADVAFHVAVVAATRNDVLIDLYGELVDALRSTVAEAMAQGGPEARFFAHPDLADAIRRGDADAAERAVGEHIAAAMQSLGEPRR